MREVEEKFLKEAVEPILNEYKKEVVSKILDIYVANWFLHSDT